MQICNIPLIENEQPCLIIPADPGSIQLLCTRVRHTDVTPFDLLSLLVPPGFLHPLVVFLHRDLLRSLMPLCSATEFSARQAPSSRSTRGE